MGMKYKVGDKEFKNWTKAQDFAVELLKSGVEYVIVFQWNEDKNSWGLLQELNLERGILPNPHFNTWALAPYYVREYYDQGERLRTVDSFEKSIRKLNYEPN